jgi:hypothetical protein
MNEHPAAPGPAPHIDILNEAMRSISDHMIDYGEPAKNYERASALASMILGKPITPYEIAIIKMAVKLSRIAETPDLRKSYVEMIACAAFAGEFVNASPITTKRFAQALRPPAGAKMDLSHLPRTTVDLDIPKMPSERAL